MARGYGQYCPLALATELLAQRWTVLVISRLIDGCSTFNAIHRGVPRISPSLLSQRLTELEHAGVVEKNTQGDKPGPVYTLTPAGEDLAPIIDQMAVWGQHWARDMVQDDLDPGFLAWSIHTRINLKDMPAGRTVLEFIFSGAPKDCRRFWLVCEDGTVDMCLKHPGFDTDLKIRSDLRLFVEAWRGFRDLRSEIAAGRIRLEGSTRIKRQFPEWLLLSGLAPYGRKRKGKEQRLSSTHGTNSRK